MSLLQKTKESFNHEFEKLARANIKRKLEEQGIDHNDLSSAEFNTLVKAEMEILESDTKKVGAGIGIGIVLSMFLGF